MQTLKTFCRNCTGVCGLEVDVDGNRVVDVRPDRTHPITRGYHCVKARMSLDLNNGAEGRLTRSLRRNTEGVLETISSVQALDEIAQRLEAIVARHGPRSVGLYYGTAAYANSLATPLAKAFLHSLGSPN